jgi:uncharacterized protein (TIGR00661 family)
MAKYLFTIQGEGRGHLTQAISLTQILEEAGHEVIGYAVGTFENRKIPNFFLAFIGTKPLIQYEAPSIIYGAGRSVKVVATAMQAFKKFKIFKNSAKRLGDFINTLQPDVIVNFYESITGLYYFTTRSSIPCISIGHQYLLLNKNFVTIKEKAIDRFLLNINTKITAYGSQKFLGLSFAPLKNDEKKKIYTVPPLLRSVVKEMKTSNEGFWLAYLTHYRLADEIAVWHLHNPEVKIDCFWDHPEIKETFEYSPNLTFHPIDAVKYLDKMSKCAGLISTAGFESVAEAMYLGKPVMMVPVPNHIEQMINAFDGERAGAGVAVENFDLDIFAEYLPHHESIEGQFHWWCEKGKNLMLGHLESLYLPPAPSIARRGWLRSLSLSKG